MNFIFSWATLSGIASFGAALGILSTWIILNVVAGQGTKGILKTSI